MLSTYQDKNTIRIEFQTLFIPFYFCPWLKMGRGERKHMNMFTWQELWVSAVIDSQGRVQKQKVWGISLVHLNAIKSQSGESKKGNLWQEAAALFSWCTWSPGRVLIDYLWTCWGTGKTWVLKIYNTWL